MRRRFRIFIALLILLGIGLAWLFKRHFMTARVSELSDYRARTNERLLTQIQVTDTTNRELTKSERHADAVQLAEALRRQPIANPQIKDEAQLDAIVAPFIEQAAAASGDQAFTQALDGMLKALNYPGVHLVGRTEYDSLRARVGSGFYESESPYAVALTDERTASRYAKLPKAPNSATPNARNTLSLRGIDGYSASLITGFQFDHAHIAADAERAASLFSDASHSAITVLDLRGVTGDSDEYWLRIIAPHLSQGEAGVSTTVNFTAGHDAYLDYFALKEQLPHFDMQDDRSELSMLLPQDAQSQLKGYAFTKTIGYTLPLSDKVTRSNRVYLLIDNRTGGAAEAFIDFCKVNKLATVAGTATSGTGWQMPPFLYRLDHSGLLFTMESGKPLNLAGDNLQSETGCIPDLPLSGDDLLAELTKHF